MFISIFFFFLAKDIKLRQMLGIFFSNYVMRVPGSLSMVEKAFIPTLNVIANAPKDSPLIDVDTDAMLKFLVEICRPDRQKCDQVGVIYKKFIMQSSIVTI